MNTSIQSWTREERTLTAHDRCDSCGSQAYVRVEGVSGELTFCAHHFSRIMNNPSAKEAMDKFAFKITDERLALDSSVEK